MADNDLTMKKWIVAHKDFSEKIQGDFMANPKATVDRLYPMNVSYVNRNRAFEPTLRTYLKDCGAADFLGECDVSQHILYTLSLFKGRKDLCTITNIVYGHWGAMPEGIIERSFFVTTPDKKTALGLAFKATDGKGGHILAIMDLVKKTAVEITQESWDTIGKNVGPLLADTVDLYFFTIASTLLGNQCPSNMNKLKFDPVIS
ncbi:MAG: hypothetical protein Q4D39_00590 [Coriobacteriaceae bacterium]|nr:hypothetical protein [Coriobacteriaceae bacterium]